MQLSAACCARLHSCQFDSRVNGDKLSKCILAQKVCGSSSNTAQNVSSLRFTTTAALLKMPQALSDPTPLMPKRVLTVLHYDLHHLKPSHQSCHSHTQDVSTVLFIHGVTLSTSKENKYPHLMGNIGMTGLFNLYLNFVLINNLGCFCIVN